MTTSSLTRRAAAVLAAAVMAGGCGSTEPSPAPASPSIPTFSSPVPAPGRVNDANDGTAFEPCVDIGAAALSAAGVDPTTWTDMSMAIGGPRGCRAVGATATLSALVIDGGVDLLYVWGPGSRGPRFDVDTTKAGGLVITHHRAQRAQLCVASVATGAATLSVSIADTAPSTPDREDLCDRADAAITSARTSLDGPRPASPTDAQLHSASANDYMVLVQQGVLPDLLRPPTINLLDALGRIRPASMLLSEHTESWTRVKVGLTDIAFQTIR